MKHTQTVQMLVSFFNMTNGTRYRYCNWEEKFSEIIADDESNVSDIRKAIKEHSNRMKPDLDDFFAFYRYEWNKPVIVEQKQEALASMNQLDSSLNFLGNVVAQMVAQMKTEEIQQKIFEKVKENCEKNYGISIVDVSILRLSLPDINLQSVFDQMRQDRQTDIDTILANADKESTKIYSDAQVKAEEIIAQGTNEAAQIKKETEKAVAEIYANAQAANLELFTFLKSLDTLAASVNSGTVLVVSTDEYPFNVLGDYANSLNKDSDEAMVEDLVEVLEQLDEKDRQALIEAIGALLEEATKGNAQ